MVLIRKVNCLSDQQLAQYIEGKVSPAEREEFEAHLSVCDSCLKVIVEAKKSLQGAAEDIVPEGLIEKLIALSTSSLKKSQISKLWVKVKEGSWQLGKEIEIAFDAVESAFSLLLPPGLAEVSLAPMPVRGDEKTILRSFEIPLPQDKIRLGVTLYMVANNEMELSIQAAGTEMPDSLIVSLCEESGRILKSETLKPNSTVCFSLNCLHYFISVEYKAKAFRIPLHPKKV
jgi:hypothetical protein